MKYEKEKIKLRFDQFVEKISERVDPAEAKVDIYVGLEHLDSASLHLNQWGTSDDVVGTKLRFYQGDVIFGRRRAYQRKLAIADFDGICSAHALVLRAKADKCLPEFLPFFLQSDSFFERAISISVGSLSPTINWRTLAKQEFLIPPIEEQRRITEILLASDEVIESFYILYSKLDELYWKLLTNYLYGSLEDSLKNKTEIGYIPENWRVERIKDLNCEDGKIVQTGPFGSLLHSSDYVDEGVPFLVIKNIQDHGLNLDELSFITENDATRLSKFRILKGDIVISRVGRIGSCVLTEESMNGWVISGQLFRLRVNESFILNEYLYLLFKSDIVQKQLNQMVVGTTRKSLNTKIIENLLLPIPPLIIQTRVIGKMNNVALAKNKISNHLEKIKLMKTYLINSMIRINDD